MKSYAFTAKSVERAIQEGLKTLGTNQEDVDIKIISEGGFLKKAKVVINVEEEIKIPDFEAPKIEKTVSKQENKTTEKNQEKQTETEKEDKKQEKIEKKEQKTQVFDQKEEKQQAKEKLEPVKTKPSFEETHTESNTTSIQFLTELCEKLGIVAKVELEEKRDCSYITIETEDVGKIIGYRGDMLNAIQYLSNVIEQKKNPHAKRVIVNAGDYKQKREESLRAMAIRAAGKVEATGRPYKMDYMNAYERRIVHTELQNYRSIETHSEGVEPRRRIIVTRKKQ